ncbi:SRPBCC family protein [Enterovirga aerilata]|uniref:SRPBCC family protein n=1 Tax=Enterovirga aerilata TaxID=2730920 RepID=A0A849IGL9_9HYPH|nr:SRPBCC family protein [Enterovirga sp. DB1703]NNM73063.1 SRPBCC family protein [Enterovirga sp. DB1703]
MTDGTIPNAYAVHPEPAALKLQRLLPGPIERVWAYLTESDLRRRWLAAGDMAPEPGAAFEFVWRNDELTNPPGERPPGSSAEHRLACRIIEFRPPTRLVIGWGENGEVTFSLEPRGGEVLLTLLHRRARDRDMLLKVTAGWHAHLDVLAARLRGEEPAPFWDGWNRLKAEYETRLPA